VKNTGIKPPPSGDLEGWRQAIAAGQLGKIRLEEIAAAFQDLGAADEKVRNALAKHLSRAILAILLNRGVNPNLPNGGLDIINRVHDVIFDALLQPLSSDGKMLRVGFGYIINFRFKDAIAKSYREQVSPVQKHFRKNKVDADKADEVTDDLAEAVDEASTFLGGEVPNSATVDQGDVTGSHEAELAREIAPSTFAPDEAESEEIAPSKQNYDPTIFDGVNATDEAVDGERILKTITDYRKRQAFRLYMDRVPNDSMDGYSIAKACGVSEKTVREWIKEIKKQLQQNEEANELLRMKIGAKP
jgi:hypothetical protein